VGEDGFVVPKDFVEFFERYPLRVRRWVTNQLSRRFGQDAILDLEQDLLLYLCTLPPDSRFRRKGANGRTAGCTDVIQCFHPVRHYGATAGRFHNFINLCLANRLSTILARQRHNPICDPRNLSIANLQENEDGPELVGEIGEAYLLRHSETFARECRRKTHAENPVVKAYIREFEQFVLQREPTLLAVVHAIERTATLCDAEKSIGMANRDFRRCRRDLSLLKNRFLEQRKSLPRTRELSSSWETPMEKETKVFLREELYERVWTTPMHWLAKEFGYSDVGLAKLCEKHNIPRPGLGYWRRLELGQKPNRPSLTSRVRVSIGRMRLKRTAFQSRFNTAHGNQDSPADAQYADFLLSYAVVDRAHTHAKSLGGLCFRERYRATYFRVFGRRRGGSRAGRVQPFDFLADGSSDCFENRFRELIQGKDLTVIVELNNKIDRHESRWGADKKRPSRFGRRKAS
jgi:hypothetical protein